MIELNKITYRDLIKKEVPEDNFDLITLSEIYFGCFPILKFYDLKIVRYQELTLNDFNKFISGMQIRVNLNVFLKLVEKYERSK